MKQTAPPKAKLVYEPPKIDVLRFSAADIITASGMGDQNQGEWDPQTVKDSTTVRWEDMK